MKFASIVVTLALALIASQIPSVNAAKDPLDEPVTRRQLIGALRPSVEYEVRIVCDYGTTNCSLVEYVGDTPRPVRDGEESIASRPRQEKVLCRFERHNASAAETSKNRSNRRGDKR